MYHINSIAGPEVLKPQVPYMVLWGEPEDARVCACPDIQGCILALDGADDLMERFVYIIENEPDVCNDELVRCYGIGSPMGEIFDVDLTGEVWYTQPVRVTLVGQLGKLVDDLTIIL